MESTLAAVILQAIRMSNGEWVSRKDIADVMGRGNALLPHDIDTLNDLVERGVIEVTRRPRGLLGFRFEYRVKES